MKYNLIGFDDDGSWIIIRGSDDLEELSKLSQLSWDKSRIETSVEDEDGKVVFTPYCED